MNTPPPPPIPSRIVDNDRNGTRYYERFHLNQFYNAVEDEQLYTDEYTNLLHSYNEFIVNGNVMFSRMEQALRANLDRSIVRQTFYYHRHSDIRRIRNPDGAIYNAPVPAPVPRPVPAPGPQPTAAGPLGPPGPPVPPPTGRPPTDTSRLSNAFGRMLANYLTTENNRNERENAYIVSDANGTRDVQGRPNANLFSMLYTYAQPRAAAAPAVSGGIAVPTPDQIRRATLNTVYAHIIAPVNNTCPISRDEFEDESEITMIRGCNHIFNRFSLREWFVNHSTCPMCRNDIRNYRDTAGATGPGPRSSAVGDIYSRIMDNSSNFMNMEINNVSNDSVTFSYDLPPLYNRYNDEDIFRDILNAAGAAPPASAPSQAPDEIPRRNRYRDDADDDADDDYMEVD